MSGLASRTTSFQHTLALPPPLHDVISQGAEAEADEIGTGGVAVNIRAETNREN